MSALIVLLIAAAAAAYTSYPLWGRREAGRPELVAVTPEMLVVDGVAYPSEDEWAVDRALDKATPGELELPGFRSRADLEAEVEERVAAVRKARSAARAAGARPTCLNCGKPFQPGDNFCSQCGEPHPRACPRCGERYRPGDRFCTVCGTPLGGGGEP